MTFSMIQYPNRTRADTQIMRLRCRGEDGSYIVTSAFTTWWLNADGHNHVEDLKSWLQYKALRLLVCPYSHLSEFTPSHIHTCPSRGCGSAAPRLPAGSYSRCSW